LGQGSSGVRPSGGGSGGSNGLTQATAANGGVYGGGAGGNTDSATFIAHTGGRGAVRIIWPGTTRSFPSTNTGDL
jgi:hypothetical protein